MRTLRNHAGLSIAQNRFSRISRKLALGLAAAVALAWNAAPARAANITFKGVLVDNNVPDAPAHLGTDGYYFYGIGPTTGASGPGGADLSSPSGPSYVSAVTPDPSASRYQGDGAFTILTIGGTQYGTGLLYGAGSQNLATITLSNVNPLPIYGFQLGILETNVDAGGKGTSITVAGSNSVTESTGLPGGSTTNTNGFYLYDVTNLVAGDVITISEVTGEHSGTIGGITFSTLTPEPSTGIMAALGAIGLFAFLRKRKTASVRCCA